jgi:hypothetical protein
MAMNGIYMVDPDADGPNQPFSVRCRMAPAGGWTLVALERPNNTENLKFLGVESGTPDDLINNQNGNLGVRFRGLYSTVRIEWDMNRFVQFDIGQNELFDDTVNLAIPISNALTSETTLQTWLAPGAKFCRAASQSANALPGDTSWAVKPATDNNNICGCNSGSWAGRGAFYGGTDPGCTSCDCHDGGFIGAKDTGEVKSEQVNWQTRIYVL